MNFLRAGLLADDSDHWIVGLLAAASRRGSPVVGKEQIALDIAKRDGIDEGLIAVITAVESCRSYDVRSDRSRGILELYPRPRKCQHLYHYMIHPLFGLMYARVAGSERVGLRCDVQGSWRTGSAVPGSGSSCDGEFSFAAGDELSGPKR